MTTNERCNCENSYCEEHDIHVAAGCENEGRYRVDNLGLVCGPCCLTYPVEYVEQYVHPQPLLCEHCGELGFDTYEQFEKSKATCEACEEEFAFERECDDEFDSRADAEEGGYGGIRFADPGGRSALRAASRENPRNLPCPTCGAENVLTPEDRACGYQCDRCADRAEGLEMEY